ncbi:hypothetical protein AVEN_31610-1 [Araneus ventricosus]|uniref:Uncharacterized protein n=1 Tax=Araneus ventricosus TaxID=182803 RepID=A0A4Y2RZA0_ARAVE|nr:hypothetical protein AVEN_31610-1 [Araneus ventricosus]
MTSLLALFKHYMYKREQRRPQARIVCLRPESIKYLPCMWAWYTFSLPKWVKSPLVGVERQFGKCQRRLRCRLFKLVVDKIQNYEG